MAYLALSVEDVIINKWQLVEGVLSLGRSDDNDIQINDASVSSNHARLTTEQDPFIDGQLITYLEDLSSTNGTELNGKKVSKEKLSHDDIIKIGFNQFHLIDKQSNKLDETAIIIG